MLQGKVKQFNHQKGYGFIQPKDGSSDVFIHISELERAGYDNLNTDQNVSYDLDTNKDKIRAVNLKLIQGYTIMNEDYKIIKLEYIVNFAIK